MPQIFSPQSPLPQGQRTKTCGTRSWHAGLLARHDGQLSLSRSPNEVRQDVQLAPMSCKDMCEECGQHPACSGILADRQISQRSSGATTSANLQLCLALRPGVQPTNWLCLQVWQCTQLRCHLRRCNGSRGGAQLWQAHLCGQGGQARRGLHHQQGHCCYWQVWPVGLTYCPAPRVLSLLLPTRLHAPLVVGIREGERCSDPLTRWRQACLAHVLL